YTGGPAPLLVSQSSLLGAAPFNPSLSYPILAVRGGSLNVFDPNITTPSVKTWSIGLQRAIGRDTAIEARYTGNRADNTRTTENWNQYNIYENGFLTEFQNAMSNLQLNLAATGTPTIALTNVPGTKPLPIYMAALVGVGTATSGCIDSSGRCPGAQLPANY